MPRPQNDILLPFRGVFEIFRRVTPSFLWGGGGGEGFIDFFLSDCKNYKLNWLGT